MLSSRREEYLALFENFQTVSGANRREYLALFRKHQTVSSADAATYLVVTGVIFQGKKRLVREVYHSPPPYIEVLND